MKANPVSQLLVVAVSVGLALAFACGSANQPTKKPSSSNHGTLTDLSRVQASDGAIELCSHKVPAQVCTQHHPELVAQFKRANDWCPEHGRPESQCFTCHPDLTFEPLPTLAADADVTWLSKAGEDVTDIAAPVVKGKVTVVDFYADWCASCRKVDGHMYKRIAGGDTTVAYRKINVMAWDSPVAMRYLQKVPSLPLLQIYDTNGKLSASVVGAELEQLDAAIAKATANK